MIRKNIFFISFLFLFLILAIMPFPVIAHCPLCSGAVGAVAVSAKYYGFDPSIIGLFVGAFAVSTGLWLGDKLKNYFKFQKQLIVLSSFLITAIPVSFKLNDSFYLSLDFISRVFWLNKILLGSFIGALIFLFITWLNNKIKLELNKSIIPFQGIIFNVAALIIAAALFYFIV